MIENIFSTPLYSNINNDEKINDEITECIDKVNFEYIKGWGKTHQITPTEDVINHYKLDNFRAFLEKCLFEYCKEVDYNLPKTYKLQSWITKFEKDDYGHIHQHGDADISGVYYFKTNGKDGDLAFYTPVTHSETSNVFGGNKTWIHSPQVGKLLMFPGYLRHGILRNTTDNTRMSVSFNIHFNKF